MSSTQKRKRDKERAEERKNNGACAFHQIQKAILSTTVDSLTFFYFISFHFVSIIISHMYYMYIRWFFLCVSNSVVVTHHHHHRHRSLRHRRWSIEYCVWPRQPTSRKESDRDRKRKKIRCHCHINISHEIVLINALHNIYEIYTYAI